MFFLVGRVCPQVLQRCCNTPAPSGKDIPELIFCFNLRFGGGGDGLDGRR